MTRGLGGGKVCVAVAVDERGDIRVGAVGARGAPGRPTSAARPRTGRLSTGRTPRAPPSGTGSRGSGVSTPTHRLANYLAWYQWSLDARRTDSPADLLADQAGLPTELTGWRAYTSTPYPFHPDLYAFTSTEG